MRQPPPSTSFGHQAPHAARRTEGTIRVRATRRGFHDHHIKEPNDEFTIQSIDEFSDKWMELIDCSASERAAMMAEWRASKIKNMPTRTDEERAAKADAERRAKVEYEKDRRAPEDEQPIALTVAEAEGKLPKKDRRSDKSGNDVL